MSDLQKAGKIRALGVSNFEIAQMQELVDLGTPPASAPSIDRTPYLHGSLLPFKTIEPPTYTAPFYSRRQKLGRTFIFACLRAPYPVEGPSNTCEMNLTPHLLRCGREPCR